MKLLRILLYHRRGANEAIEHPPLSQEGANEVTELPPLSLSAYFFECEVHVFSTSLTASKRQECSCLCPTQGWS